VSKIANNVGWSFVGWILILAGLMFVVQGYKPIVFVIGILIILYRQVILHSEKYESQIKN
jgi:hypothetical protein